MDRTARTAGQRAALLLAAGVVLGGVASWGLALTAGPARRAAGALDRRQLDLERRLSGVLADGPAAPELGVVTTAVAEVPFVRYLAYPLPVRELPARRAAAAALAPGALVLVSAPGGQVEALERLVLQGLPGGGVSIVDRGESLAVLRLAGP